MIAGETVPEPGHDRASRSANSESTIFSFDRSLLAGSGFLLILSYNDCYRATADNRIVIIDPNDSGCT